MSFDGDAPSLAPDRHSGRERGTWPARFLARLADTFTPTCACGDGARALAHVLDALAGLDAYRAGREAAEHDAAQARAELLADAQRRGWCEHVHPAVEDAAGRMFSGWGGATLAHAESVARFRAEYVPHAVSSPRCGCGDWARGYAYRDALTRYGGALEADAAGVLAALEVTV